MRYREVRLIVLNPIPAILELGAVADDEVCGERLVAK
jgi:hypothetical protein